MIHVIIGPPCSGKSTFVRENAAPGDVRIDYDDLSVAFGAETSHAGDGPVRQVTLAARSAAILRVTSGVPGDSWVIHTSPSPARCTQYAAAGAEFTVLDPGVDVCLARAVSDDRPGWTADAINEWYADPPALPDVPGQQQRSGFQRTLGHDPGQERTPMIKTIVTRFKTLDVGEKASDGTPAAGSGIWESIVSAFDNQDQYGDVVKKGAFTRTLGEWQDRGENIPVYYSHRLDDPNMNIGWTVEAEERDAKDGAPAGLWTLNQADMDNPVAAQTYKLMKARRLTNASFSYMVPQGGEEYVEPADPKADPWETGDFGHYLLKDITLFETGPTPVGANPLATILPVKSGARLLVPQRLIAAKAGKVLSSKNLTSLQSARDILDQVIKDAEAAPDAGKAGRVRRESLVLSRAFGDPADPPADGPAPTMDSVKTDVQDAADSLKSALDGLDALGSKTAPPGGKSAVVSTRSRGPVKGEAEGVHSVSVDRLRLLADSLTLS